MSVYRGLVFPAVVQRWITMDLLFSTPWCLHSCSSSSRSSSSISRRRGYFPWSDCSSRPSRFPYSCMWWPISCCAGRAGSLPRRDAEAISHGLTVQADHRDSHIAVYGCRRPCCAGRADSLPCRDAEADSMVRPVGGPSRFRSCSTRQVVDVPVVQVELVSWCRREGDSRDLTAAAVEKSLAPGGSGSSP